MNILVVDDDLGMRAYMNAIIASAGLSYFKEKSDDR